MESDKLTLKLICKHKAPRIANLGKKKQANKQTTTTTKNTHTQINIEGFSFHFKNRQQKLQVLRCCDTVIKWTLMQISEIKLSLETNPMTCGQFDFDKGAKII